MILSFRSREQSSSKVGQKASPLRSGFWDSCVAALGTERLSLPPVKLTWFRLCTEAVPYTELIRLSKPVGFLYLYLPCLLGSILAASLAFVDRAPVAYGQLAYINVVFFVGSFMVRSLGCTWNDICDQDFDRRVARTLKRPLARGAVTSSQALAFVGAQLLLGAITVLATLPLACFWLAAPSIALGFCYPLAKRVTNYPQVVLGLTFSWGVWLAFAALGQPLDPRQRPDAFTAALSLYLACSVWTVIYDMVYAAQDAGDDRREGIGSIFVRFANSARLFLSLLLLCFHCLLLLSGHHMLATWRYYTLACGAATSLMAYMIWDVDFTASASCQWWFSRGSPMAGGAIALGLALEYWHRCLTASS